MRYPVSWVSPWAAGLLVALVWLVGQPQPAASLDPRRPATRYARQTRGVADGLREGTITAIAQGPSGHLHEQPTADAESIVTDGPRLAGDPMYVLAGTRRLVFRFNDEWVNVGKRPKATYHASFSPGTQRFSISTANADGVWSGVPATLGLMVGSAFWQTPFFFATCLLLLIAACVGIYRLRLARLRAENAILRERERISAEVHDAVAQTFSGALLKLERAEAAAATTSSEVRELVSGARQLLAESWTEIRRTIQGLRPRALERNELCAALALLVDSLSGAGPDVHIEVVGDPQPLSEDTANGLWRFAQEALANAARHAEARNIWVRLQYDDKLVRLTVADDGRGLAREAVQTPGTGMGLFGIKRRARAHGWAFTIRSGPAGGTEITVEASLEANRTAGRK
ncbi:MAG: sensor histidine kinase [Acidobacteria bacterium]|nr:sensor histidine kinase [Acidobacteriota bacterium]